MAFPPGDVRSGALTLMRAIQYLPEGVALAVVDPGVGTARRAIAAETAWGQFVGPDNGLLSPAVAIVEGAQRVVSIENPELVIPSSGATFEGRDRFAPAAALLASGEAGLDDLGTGDRPGKPHPAAAPAPRAGGRRGPRRGMVGGHLRERADQRLPRRSDRYRAGSRVDGDGAVPRRRARGAVGRGLRRRRARRGTAPRRFLRIGGAGGARRPGRSRPRAGRPTVVSFSG